MCRKITKIIATRCQILRLKCTKFDLSWSSTPDLAGGAYSSPQTLLLDLTGLTSQGREGKSLPALGVLVPMGQTLVEQEFIGSRCSDVRFCPNEEAASALAQQPVKAEPTEPSKVQQVSNMKELRDVYIPIQLYNRKATALLETSCDTSIIGARLL